MQIDSSALDHAGQSSAWLSLRPNEAMGFKDRNERLVELVHAQMIT